MNMVTQSTSDQPGLQQLKQRVREQANELGFQHLGVSDTDLHEDEKRLERWLAANRHGDMHYMARHGRQRSRPAELVPGTLRVISVRMDYSPPHTRDAWEVLDQPALAYISRYALGRDYHKLMRKRLQKLAAGIAQTVGEFGYRVFVDSAPVLEKPLAAKAGLGWMGKHTNILSREAGSWFFLGEIYTDLPLPVDQPVSNHCGSCTACIDICPTRAITAPYHLDARRCISYLTIEHHGSIPKALRPDMGNRIYGCDDCQLVCPWNRYAQITGENDFAPRHGLDAPDMVELFQWSEEQFLQKTEGSAIRRIGHIRWLRNIAVALGNALADSKLEAANREHILDALRERLTHDSPLVREHVQWALEQGNR